MNVWLVKTQSRARSARIPNTHDASCRANAVLLPLCARPRGQVRLIQLLTALGEEATVWADAVYGDMVEQVRTAPVRLLRHKRH